MSECDILSLKMGDPNSITRRAFLGALALPAFADSRADEKAAGFRLGAATFSLKNFSRARAIEMLQLCKVEAVSVKEAHAKIKDDRAEWAKARKEFESAGLRIVSVGKIDFAVDSDEDVERNFQYAQALGAAGIVMAPKLAVLPRIERFVKQYNIKAFIHCHGPEDKVFPTPESVLRAVKGMDARMGLCLDSGHTLRAGVDLIAAMKQAGPRLLDFHIKDLRDLKNRGTSCQVGDGAVPVSAIFSTLKQMGYRGDVNLEYEVLADNPLPGMLGSFAYMRGALAGMNV